MKPLRSLILLLSPTILVLAGCTPPTESGDSVEATEKEGDVVQIPDMTDPRLIEDEYAAHLLKKGQELAQRELGRMAAAELTYRNKAEFHQLPHGDLFADGQGTFVKLYRNFTGYEIEDIYRSESFLYPIAYQIRFSFDM